MTPGKSIARIALTICCILLLAMPYVVQVESSASTKYVTPPVFVSSTNRIILSNSTLYHPHSGPRNQVQKISQNCLDNASLSVPPLKIRIALVQPVFTATPYSQYAFGSFYAFYHKYGNFNGNITAGLGLLNTSVTSSSHFNNGWGHSYSLYQFMSSQAAKDCGLVLGNNVFVISDINITEGALFFPNGTSRFDLAIAGFSEYVTLPEYDAYRQFVARGGELVLMSGDNFFAEVGYSASSNHEWLISGHGWQFNGKSAWHGPSNMWLSNNTNWVGSYLCCFHKFHYHGATANRSNPLGASLQRMFANGLFLPYASHEEDSIRNFTRTSIIATFANQSGVLVAAYIHHYKQGTVVCYCAFGTDILARDQSTQYFLVLSAGLDLNRSRVLLPSTSVHGESNSATLNFSGLSGGLVIAAIEGVGIFAALKTRFKKSIK